MKLENGKLRTDNKTGIPGVHKFIYPKQKPGAIPRKKKKKDKWTVQFKSIHICVSYSLDDAVYRRWEEEKNAHMHQDDPTKSKAYAYLKERNLL